LARRALEGGLALPRLKQLRTFGEVLGNDTIAVCRRAWNVSIADIYSSEEAGYIASQCERGTYHVQAENLIVEILDDAGNACAPGQCGRVVITTLHNFVMPLIRYDIGDYAEVGTPCACGRGLPVLRRIVGRRRNMLRLPDGTQHWPSFPEERWVGIAPIEQLQVVQTALDEIVLRVAAKRALTAEENARLIAAFKDTLRFPHGIAIEQVASIPRKPNAKFEDFVSEIEQAL
jgi:phenylacetate-CoA ligase